MNLIEITVPDIGDFTDVEVIEILVKPGDDIAVEQSLVTVESDKASMEIPSAAAGQLKELKVHGDRLYFAGYRDFGYINLTAWTPGEIYGGLESLRDPERRRRGELMTGDMSRTETSSAS